MAADMDARQHAHQLLEQLARRQLEAVTRLLEVMVHPEEAHDALTEEDRRVVAASREYFQMNPDGGVSFEEVVADCGFTMDDIRNIRGEQ